MLKLTDKTISKIYAFEKEVSKYSFNKPQNIKNLLISESAVLFTRQDDYLLQITYIRATDQTLINITKVYQYGEDEFDVDYIEQTFSNWLFGFDAISIINLIEERI